MVCAALRALGPVSSIQPVLLSILLMQVTLPAANEAVVSEPDGTLHHACFLLGIPNTSSRKTLLLGQQQMSRQSPCPETLFVMHSPKRGSVASSSWGCPAVLTPHPKSSRMPQSLEGSPTAGSMSGRLSFASALMLLKPGCCTANTTQKQPEIKSRISQDLCRLQIEALVWVLRPRICILIAHLQTWICSGDDSFPGNGHPSFLLFISTEPNRSQRSVGWGQTTSYAHHCHSHE